MKNLKKILELLKELSESAHMNGKCENKDCHTCSELKVCITGIRNALGDLVDTIYDLFIQFHELDKIVGRDFEKEAKDFREKFWGTDDKKMDENIKAYYT